jgi:maleate isomerase
MVERKVRSVSQRLRVGVLTPHAAVGSEAELPDMASGRVVAVVVRVWPPGIAAEAVRTPPTAASALRSLTRGPALDRAAVSIRNESVDAVAYASTSSGYALGHRAEAELVERLRHRCGAPVVASGSAAVEALRTCRSQQVALVHPPWFDDEIDELGVRYFRDQGFDVKLSKATDLPNEPHRVRPEHVVDWVTRHLDDQADAVFIGGNGLRAAHAIDELERVTGRLVLEANQVLLWSILAATRTAWEVNGYGRLFLASPSWTN